MEFISGEVLFFLPSIELDAHSSLGPIVLSFILVVVSDFLYIMLLLSSAELEKNADEEKIKVAYRRLAKFYHPDGVFSISVLVFSRVL